MNGFGPGFLLLVGVLLPYLAVKSARRMGDRPLPISRERLFAQVIATHAVLFALAYVAARQNHIALWTLPRTPLLSWGTAAGLMVAAVATLKLRWKSRSAASKERLYGLVPHDGRERVLYTGVCVSAGFAEEIVYRGVFTGLVALITGNLVIAAILSAIAFGFAHSIQGVRAMIATALIGLSMQMLVAIAGSLIPAMVVHAAYDFVAGILVPRWYGQAA